MASASKDLYDVLGVARTAPKEEIRKRYKKLARELHPDVNPGDKRAEQRFKEVNAAYAILQDEEKRKLYDEFGDIALRTGFDAAKARELREAMAHGGFARGGGPGFGGEEFDFSQFAQGFSGFRGFGEEEGGAGFEDILSSMLGGRRGRRARRGAEPGEDIEAALSIDLPTALRGGATTIALEKPTTCPQCGGAGSANGGGRPCPRCAGSGRVVARETVEVKIPPGIRDGQKLRLAGLGGPGRLGGPDGDLYVRVQVEPHAVFRREGDDLHVEVPVTVGEAVAGATVDIETPTGRVALKVPAGTQTGRKLRLRGLGAPSKDGKGDLIARVLVHAPDKDSPEVRELAAKLDRFYSGEIRREPRVRP